MLPAIRREPWGLTIKHASDLDPAVPWWRYHPDTDTSAIRGDDAMRAAAQLLPHLNHKGASARVVKEAVEIATQTDDPRASFESAAALQAKLNSWDELATVTKLAKVPPALRLAMEMVSHEDSERRALEGELYLLEAAWRDAEEIADISDNLFLPSDVSTKLTDLKRRVK
jgi:hypothetical protein